MEIDYTIKFPEETHKVKVTCQCGQCSLLSSRQLADLRQKLVGYRGQDSPELIRVVDNAEAVVSVTSQST
jgi:hypothetical protein